MIAGKDERIESSSRPTVLHEPGPVVAVQELPAIGRMGPQSNHSRRTGEFFLLALRLLRLQVLRLSLLLLEFLGLSLIGIGGQFRWSTVSRLVNAV